MKVCSCAGQKVSISGALHSEGAAIDLPDDEAAEMIALGIVEKAAAPKKAAPKKAAPKKAKAKDSQ